MADFYITDVATRITKVAKEGVLAMPYRNYVEAHKILPVDKDNAK